MLTPKFITLEETIIIHQDQIEAFGGTDGIRDRGLLESALAQPQASFGGQFLHQTIYEQAAAYLYHIVMNHPFLDGNKRTAFAVMDTFIRINGYVLTLTNEEAYELVMQTARKQINKDEIKVFLEKAIVDFLD